MSSVVRKAYVDLPDGQVHCRIVQGAGPAILFLHQAGSSSQSYDPLLAALDLPHPLVAIDTPGFGGSFDPEGTPSLRTYAEWLVATADALGIEAFHIFGHHTGASVALEIAAWMPGRTRSIMLSGPVFMTGQERNDFLRDYRPPAAPARDGSHMRDTWRYAAERNPNCDVGLIHQEVVSMLRAWRGRPQAYMAVAAQDAFRLARDVSAPVLLLTSPDDYAHAMLDRAQALFPDASVAVTAGNNFQPSADPEGVARAIENFLAGLPTSGRLVRPRNTPRDVLRSIFHLDI